MSNLELEEIIFSVLSEYQESTSASSGPLDDLRVNLVREIGAWLGKKRIKKQLHETEDGLDERRYQHSDDNNELFGSASGIDASIYGYSTSRSPKDN